MTFHAEALGITLNCNVDLVIASRDAIDFPDAIDSGYATHIPMQDLGLKAIVALMG